MNQEKKTIKEINQEKYDDFEKKAGKEQLDKIKRIRDKYLKNDIEKIPAPLLNGVVEYSYSDDEFKTETGREEHSVTETYENGQLVRAKMCNTRTRYETKQHYYRDLKFTPSETLEKEKIYASSYGYIENFYREDETLKSFYSNYGDFDKEIKKIEYAEDGKTIVKYDQFTEDPGYYDGDYVWDVKRHDQDMTDINGNTIYFSCYKDKYDSSAKDETDEFKEYSEKLLKSGKDDVYHYIEWSRKFYDINDIPGLLKHRKVSKNEFLEQLDEKAQGDDDIIPQLGMSKKEIDEFIKKGENDIKEYYEKGIITDEDLDKVMQLKFYISGKIEKICSEDERDYTNYTKSIYNSDGKLITKKIFQNGKNVKNIDTRSSKQPHNLLTYKIGNVHSFQEVAETIKDEKISNINNVISEINETVKNKTHETDKSRDNN